MSGGDQLGTIRKLFAHLEWADRQVIAALSAAPSPNSRALELLAHLLAAEHVWLARIRQGVPSFPVWPSLDLAECAALAARNRTEIERFLGDADETMLASEVAYTNSAGVSFCSRIDDMILQVVTHGAYHRGQIALLLRGDGAAPAPTDFIGFVRGVPAATRSETKLIPIEEDGTPGSRIEGLPAAADDVSRATASLYARVGFEPPWIGYFVLEQGQCVGTCAFTAPPSANRVEIAYFTFPENEGRGVATRAAAELVRIARVIQPDLVIVAHTLPEENASTSILKKLAFRLLGEVNHPEDGIIWEWQLDPRS